MRPLTIADGWFFFAWWGFVTAHYGTAWFSVAMLLLWAALRATASPQDASR